LLRRAHGPRRWTSRGRGLDVLVAMMLAQNTNVANARAGYRMLRRRFESWDDVMAAPVRDVQREIAVCGLARMRARRLQSLLRKIREEEGTLDLDFLRDWEPQAAYEYSHPLLRHRPENGDVHPAVRVRDAGVPRGQAGPARRAAQRTVAPARGEQVIARALEPLIEPKNRYAMHVLMHAHGRQFCRPRNPRCRECALLELCPYGRRRVRHHPPPPQLREPRLRPIILSRRPSDA
jgi:endonuclease-3